MSKTIQITRKYTVIFEQFSSVNSILFRETNIAVGIDVSLKNFIDFSSKLLSDQMNSIKRADDNKRMIRVDLRKTSESFS